jgi:hypothetical protein
MRVEFCIFTDQDGHDVYINPLLVRYFQSYSFDEDERKTTSVVFDGMHSVIVAGSPDEVEQRLSLAD